MSERVRLLCCYCMTINADFFKLIKEGCPKAFSDTPPLRASTVFIDGQVKLMKADAVQTWSLFFNVQFFRTIENGFALGADTVILGFDDYAHVPASKTMTQVKRAKQKVDYNFAQTCCLPSKMPEDWGSAMANRTFKVKVILKVLQATKEWYLQKLALDPLYKNRNLVLDYVGIPELLHLQTPDRAPNLVEHFIAQHDWTPKSGTVGRGECDIKAYRWKAVSKVLYIFSTDGDYLPLSLLQSTFKKQDAEKEPIQSGDSLCETEVPCSIILFRMTTQLQVATTCKRKIPQEIQSSLPAKSSRRTYEYVSVEYIGTWLIDVMPSKAVNPILQFCAMVALCGCDFARNLPRLGPRTLWKLRQRMQNTDLLQAAQAVCALAMVYADLFLVKNTVPRGVCNTVEWFRNTDDSTVCTVFDDVATRIQRNQGISQRIKEQLWDSDKMIAHTRNAMWTMHYWTMLENCPDPHAANFGYILDCKGRTHFGATTREGE